jgi:hypothetical protein
LFKRIVDVSSDGWCGASASTHRLMSSVSSATGSQRAAARAAGIAGGTAAEREAEKNEPDQ